MEDREAREGRAAPGSRGGGARDRRITQQRDGQSGTGPESRPSPICAAEPSAHLHERRRRICAGCAGEGRCLTGAGGRERWAHRARGTVPAPAEAAIEECRAVAVANALGLRAPASRRDAGSASAVPMRRTPARRRVRRDASSPRAISWPAIVQSRCRQARVESRIGRPGEPRVGTDRRSGPDAAIVGEQVGGLET